MNTHTPTFLPILSASAVISILAPTLYAAIPVVPFTPRPPVEPAPVPRSEGLLGEFEYEMQ